MYQADISREHRMLFFNFCLFIFNVCFILKCLMKLIDYSSVSPLCPSQAHLERAVMSKKCSHIRAECWGGATW